MFEPWEEHDYASQHSTFNEVEKPYIEQGIDICMISPLQVLTESIENLIDIEMLEGIGDVSVNEEISGAPTESINADIDEFTMQTHDNASEKSNDKMIFENLTNLNAIFPGATPP